MHAPPGSVRVGLSRHLPPSHVFLNFPEQPEQLLAAAVIVGITGSIGICVEVCWFGSCCHNNVPAAG